MIRAVIFDFDGTVIDTETAWYIAFRDAYKEHGVDLTLEMYSLCIGTSLQAFNPYEYLVVNLHLPIDLDSFRQSVHERHATLMDAEKMRPGIMDYLNSARAKRLKIALASSSKLDWVEKFLEKLQIREYFDCIRTANDVEHVKPDPELYLQTLQCLGVTADEAIAIEDSPNGAKAAVAAGVHCVVVPNTITKLLEFERFSQMANSLTEIDFDDLLSSPLGVTGV
ncbi:MAG: HAD family hydrolase [Bacilli bacterium]